MSRHILMVVTSADRLLNGEPTGLWLEEFAIPYQIFLDAGCRVRVASPQGGATPLDPRSVEDERPEWQRARELLRDTEVLDTRLSARDFDAIFLPGGHGTVFDLPGHPVLGRLLAEFDAQKKIWAAVCHGPSAFVGAERQDGLPLVEGRQLTAFSDAEEMAMGLEQAVPFLLESTLRELGGLVEVGESFAPFVIRDHNLITGQNPASSELAARRVLEALEQAQRA
ncbi:MAG TPA: type 1 glutamine amidotransferase domain-containing protein [Pseudomonas sp.]|uniref:type 1 glutamine amidotransferase domain-containing protein n=1 Tax=Pseudomonas sp. TaxID=306 RepID=UPI002B9DA85F|nr:type 1 glutamine amidotransferase domain-containing protein [Pseudomonas sp.]HTO19390.1 type 1 glutamine amidotransferase domain-containing protein [Pseudomonas sp.]